MNFKRIVVSAVILSSGCLTAYTEEPAALRRVAKPADTFVERRVLSQPSVPDGARDIPFIETAAEPVPAEAEKQRGYILFQRSITEAIYANTRPLAHERIDLRVAVFDLDWLYLPLMGTLTG